MNDTTENETAQQDGGAPEPADQEFNRDGLRTLASMRRSSDDRIVAGVCGGVARHLNVDPIIIRIAVVALTFIGLAGLILYLAAWFLIPSDDDPQSVAADWFKLERNEEQFRTVGLFVALVLAVAAIVSDNSWGFWWIGWWVIPAAFLFWLFVVRPRRRDELAVGAVPPPYPSPASASAAATTAGATVAPATTQVDEYKAWKTAQVLQRRRARAERRRESRILTALTLSVVLIALAITLVVDQTVVDIPSTSYFAVALTVVALGCLVGTVWGNPSGLIWIGLVLTVALTAASVRAEGPVGRQDLTPQTAQAVRADYRHGVGEFELDLTQVNRTADLVGRTVRIEAGAGRTAVYLPEGLPASVDVQLRAGRVEVFGKEWSGPRNRRTVTDGTGPRINLVIKQRVGDVEVVRR